MPRSAGEVRGASRAGSIRTAASMGATGSLAANTVVAASARVATRADRSPPRGDVATPREIIRPQAYPAGIRGLPVRHRAREGPLEDSL